MTDRTRIEWTDATWNPVTGCDKVSPGCDHCYAETIAHRFAGTKAYPDGFKLTLRPERLDQPLRWRRPRRIFVNSMSDLFHDDIPDAYIGTVFDVMARAERHTFQILTKRHGRMRSLLRRWAADGIETDLGYLRPPHRPMGAVRMTSPQWTPPPNVWLGVSVEDQKWADIRIPVLLDTPAAVRFLSCEPLLGRIDLTRIAWTGGGGTHLDVVNGKHGIPDLWQASAKRVDWVIVGGESGAGARPMHPDWARHLRNQCVAAGVPFHFKQHGEWVEDVDVDPDGYRHIRIPSPKDPKTLALHPAGMTAMHPGNPFNPWERGHPDWTAMRRVGKKTAGRELDGRTWDQYPDDTDATEGP